MAQRVHIPQLSGFCLSWKGSYRFPLKEFGGPLWVGPCGFPTTPKRCIYCPFQDSASKTIPSMVFGTQVLKWAVYGLFEHMGLSKNRKPMVPNARTQRGRGFGE